MDTKKLIDVAAGREPADLVLKGGRLVNVFTEEVYEADVAIAGDRIAGDHTGEVHHLCQTQHPRVVEQRPQVIG